MIFFKVVSISLLEKYCFDQWINDCNWKLFGKFLQEKFGGIQKERFDCYTNVIAYEVEAKNIFHSF